MNKYLKMISPFYHMEDVPKIIYIIKKLLAFLLLYFGSAVLGEAIVIGVLSAMGYWMKDHSNKLQPKTRSQLYVAYFM